MADAGDGSNEIENTAQSAEKLKSTISEINNMAQSLKKVLGDIGSSLSDVDEAGAKGLSKTSESLGSLTKGFRSLVGDLDKMSTDKMARSLESGLTQAGQAASKFGITMLGYMKDAENATGEFGRAVNATIPLLATLGQQSVVSQIPKQFQDVEASLKAVERTALQAGTAFGDMDVPTNYENVAGNVAKFNAELANSIVTTKRSQDQVLAVGAALKDSFGPVNAITPLKGVIAANQALNSSITATNAALLISNATGVDASQVAKMMSESYLNLGMGIEESVKMFGHIADAAKTSGLGFERTAGTIHGMAQSLKFWGTTVEGVTPLFKTFANSMQGIGQQGLTPELLNSFVNGLERMTFGTRALLGLQSPGMGRGGPTGVLGAGLQMEQALEEGDFGTIAENLISTLQQYGGQDIMTRQEALDSPGAQRNYMVQRQLLGQMLNISDTATQNKMLKVLQDIDKGGMAQAADAKAELGKVLGQGEETAEDTTTRIEKANLAVEAAVLSSGAELLQAVQGLARGTDLQKALQGVQTVTEQAARMGGVDLNALKRQLQNTTDQRERVEDRLENEELTEPQRTQLQQEQGALRATELSQSAQINFEQVMSQLFAKRREEGELTERQAERYVETGAAPKGITEQAATEALMPLKQRIAELGKLREEGQMGADQIAEYNALQNSVKQLQDTLGQKAERPKPGDLQGAIAADTERQRRKRIVEGAYEGNVAGNIDERIRQDAEAAARPVIPEAKQPETPEATTTPEAQYGPMPVFGAAAREAANAAAITEQPVAERAAAETERNLFVADLAEPAMPEIKTGRDTETREVELVVKPKFTVEGNSLVISMDSITTEAVKKVRDEMAIGRNN